jgi:hypothetical protein
MHRERRGTATRMPQRRSRVDFDDEMTIYARPVSALHLETEVTMTNDSREREAR